MSTFPAAVNDISGFRQPRRYLVQRPFKFDTSQPSVLSEPIEDRDARVEFQIQLVRVGTTIRRPSAGLKIAAAAKAPMCPILKSRRLTQCERSSSTSTARSHGVVTGDPKEDKTNFMVWTTEASIQNGSEYLLKTMETVDTVLLGRATYEDLGRMSKWLGVKSWPGVNDLALRLGEKINGAHKLVVTRNKELKLQWGEYEAPKQLPGDHLEARIRELKNSSGGNIIIFGSPTLVQSLTDAGLIDVFHIAVRPVVVSVGEHLFDDLKARKDFHLMDVHAFDDGSFVVTYEPADTASKAR